jgi:hypothetical protein
VLLRGSQKSKEGRWFSEETSEKGSAFPEDQKFLIVRFSSIFSWWIISASLR